MCFHVEQYHAQLSSGKYTSPNDFVHGGLYDSNQPLELSSSPRSPAQVKFPGNVVSFKETLEALNSSQLAKPFRSLDKGASIVRVDNAWSAAMRRLRQVMKLLVSRLDSNSRYTALDRLHVKIAK